MGQGRQGDEDFAAPPAAYRSLPFWAWNDRIEEGEVAAQARAMKARGMGGFFIHSRDGLETPYLGEEWMRAARAAVRTAEEEGLEAWLYDEDRWPSGSAGGRVPALGDEYRAKGLTLEILEGDYEPAEAASPAGASRAVAAYAARIEGLALSALERLDPALPRGPVEGSSVLVFRIEVAERDEWFNGESPPDNLNPRAVDAFIRMSYEPYRDALGASFGKAVAGVFTDEPSVHDRHSRYTEGRGWVPWTYGFADFFRSRRGYDPFEAIPLVFFDGEGQARIRHDYWRTVSELFSESYTKRLADWCACSGLKLTGHYLWENQLGTAARTGGAVMPHYRFMQAPGIDLLCEQTEETLTVKQCSSVANQYGRELVVSETDGCGGWEHSFEAQKWQGDWQIALGVTRRCQHLALYSLKGCRKRDYPPSFDYNTTWADKGRIVEDYFARVSAALSPGRPVRDILVLHPASTAWCRLGSDPRGFADRGKDRNLPEVNAYGDEFNRLLRAILGQHYDFDLGDETILAEEGGVEGGRLRVNRATYKLVLVPPIDTMLASTLELLLSFLDGGGRVVAMSPRATMVEGRGSREIDRLYGHRNAVHAPDQGSALGAIEAALPRDISLRNSFGVEDPEILCMLRRDAGGNSVLFAANNDRGKGREIIVELRGESTVEEMDPLTGRIGRIEAWTGEGMTRFRADFGPAGSRLYRFAPGAAQARAARQPSFSESPNFLINPPILLAFGPVAEFRRKEPNALVLDSCAYELEGGPWSGEMAVWKAQKEIRGALGMRQVYYNGLAQRYLWSGEPHPRDGAPVRLKFRFQVAAVPEGECFLVVEDPGEYGFELNGWRIEARDEGWFLDKSFRKISLPRLSLGWNELILSCGYKNRMEVEDCFILGDFAVDGGGAIAAEPKALRFGDWCLQGYPNYCGSMVYGFDFDFEAPEGPAVLSLGDYSAIAAEIRLNGQVAGLVPWRSANRVELGDLLRPGRNRLEIEVTGSPRNLLGPLHLARGKVYFNEWSAFRPEGAEEARESVLHPYGLFGQAILSRP